ncbi:MAG: ATP-binding protein, partial [Treponema sp.]|nr:ATP-binding protein [Treponema sp.]
MHYTLCDMVADLAQNSSEAGAALVQVDVGETDSGFSFVITDNGKGMSTETLERAKDPFYTDGLKHPNRKVGLGIPFLIQTAADTGGSWDIQSEPGKGTKVSGGFDTANIDTPPAGNIPRLFRGILTFPGTAEIVITRKRESHRHPENRLDYSV